MNYIECEVGVSINDKYTHYYNQPSIQKVLSSASFKYKHMLAPDDLEDAQMVALWRCLKKFDAAKGNTLKNSLYRYVIWECRTAVRKKANTPPMKSLSENWYDGYAAHNAKIVEEVLDELNTFPANDRTVLKEHFYGGKTFEAIDEEYGWSPGNASFIYESAVENLKCIYADERPVY